MKTILLLTMITAIFMCSLHGQAVDTQQPPVFRAGDSWLYRHYEVDGRNAFRISQQTVRSVTSTQISVDSRRIDLKEPDEVLEWKADEYPLPFPVPVGKIWEKRIFRKGVEVGVGHYKAVRFEKVSTPAGDFDTLFLELSYKIPSGTFRQYLWYSPVAHAFIKISYVNADNTLGQTMELIWYRLQ